MDFGNAVLLIAVVTAATGLVKQVVPAGWLGGARTRVVVLGLSIGAVFLVGETVWASAQVIGEQSLDKLGAWDKVVVGVLVGFGANVFDRTLKTVANVGDNVYDDAPGA